MLLVDSDFAFEGSKEEREISESDDDAHRPPDEAHAEAGDFQWHGRGEPATSHDLDLGLIEHTADNRDIAVVLDARPRQDLARARAHDDGLAAVRPGCPDLVGHGLLGLRRDSQSGVAQAEVERQRSEHDKALGS